MGLKHNKKILGKVEKANNLKGFFDDLWEIFPHKLILFLLTSPPEKLRLQIYLLSF